MRFGPLTKKDFKPWRKTERVKQEAIFRAFEQTGNGHTEIECNGITDSNQISTDRALIIESPDRG